MFEKYSSENVDYVHFWVSEDHVRIARGWGNAKVWGPGWEYENVSLKDAKEILEYLKHHNPGCKVRGDLRIPG